MRDDAKTKNQLIDELEELRGRVAALEGVDAERSRAVEVLHRSEAKWRSVAENAPLFVAVVDQFGKMQFLNRYRPGFEPATVLGRDFCDFIQPEYHAIARECLKHVFQSSEATSYESVGAGGEGTLAEFVTDVGPVIVDGEIIAATLISRDMTDRKRADEALRESEERYRLLAECIPHPVWRSDAEGRQIDCNRRWQEYTGQTPEEAQGNGWMKALHPDDVVRAVERVREDVPEGKLYQAEYRLHRASDDSYHWYLARAIPRRDANGTILGWFGCAIDIDDQKQAEGALRVNEERMRQAVRAANLGVFEHDHRTDVIQWSAEMRQIYGIGPEESVSISTILDFYHPDDREGIVAAIQRAHVPTGDGTYSADSRIIRRDGSVRWLSRRSKTFFDNEAGVPRPMRTVGVVMDITDRKRAEEALQESEKRFRAIYEQAPLGIALIDSHTGQFLRINPKYCEIAGRTQEEMLKLDFQSITHPDDLQADLDNMARLIKGTTRFFNMEKRYSRPDGSIVWVGLTVVPMWTEEERPRCHIAMVEDITERKRAAEALRESEERYRTLAESTSDIIYILDESGTLRYANQAAAAYIGVSPASLVGKTQRDLFPPDFVEHHVARIQRVFETGEAGEMEKLCRFGSQEVWLNVRTIPLRDKQGKVTSLMGVCCNITARKEAEEALRKAHDELERRVQERTADLQKANEELDVFRRFAEASRQGFGMADMDGFFTYMNPAACRIVGVAKPEDVIGKHLTTCYPEGYMLRRESEIFPALLRDGHWEGELVLSSAGKTMYVLQNSFLIEDGNGNPTHIASVTTDITARKQAEAALHESEERYRTLIETSPDAVIMLDSEGHITFASQRALELYGSEHVEELLGRNPLEFFAPEDQQKFLTNLQRTRDEGITRDVEYTFMRRDGSRLAGEGSAAVIRDISGKTTGLVATVRDITGRKQAEEALRTSEERFRSYFEQGLIGMAVSLPDRRWIQVNDRYCDMLGYSREELLGMKWTDLTHPDDLERNLIPLNRALAGESEHHTLEKRYIRKDGSIMCATVFARCFRRQDGSVDHFLSLVEDITQHKRDQEALRRSEERYELAVRGAGVGIWDWDIRTGKVYYSPRWKMVFGYDENEIGGSVDDWARLLHPDERDWILKFQDDFLAGTSTTVTVEYRLRHKDGSYRWIVAHGLVLRDEQGKAIRLVGSHGDITDRKVAEEALERERQSLWRMLQASDHERQTISYEIHDGLTQYLAGATMQFQVHDALKEGSPKKARKAYETAVELVHQAHSEARRLINEVRPPVIDENGIEMAISHLVHEQRRHGGPKIECHSDVQFGRLPPILENAIYRIAQEALTNACKHSKSKNVAVTMTQEGQVVRLEVRDNGIGFDPATVQKGHFGLEGIRQRVRLLGGRLTVESQPDSGTLVQVVVPIVERQNEG
jgi:PAS domain S-box-containing protein